MALADLNNYLNEINGQDAYSNLNAALGSLSQDEYLRVPIGHISPAANRVGARDTLTRHDADFYMQVYALNKARAPQGCDAVRFAMLRMEAVRLGWSHTGGEGRSEIMVVPPIETAVETYTADAVQIKREIALARKAAWLIPFAAEHTFRSMGHHYLTSQSAVYRERYARTLRSCLAEDALNFLPENVLFHTALHWVGPWRVKEVLAAQVGTDRIPEAVQLRARSAPAGTAVISTTAAVLRAMASLNLRDELVRLSGVNIRAIEREIRKIEANPWQYHKTPHAYRLQALNDEAAAELIEGKIEAGRLAPVCQGFINAMFQNASLGRAEALKKHAQENPMLTAKAERFFRALAKKQATTLNEVFKADIKVEQKDRQTEMVVEIVKAMALAQRGVAQGVDTITTPTTAQQAEGDEEGEE